MPHRACAHARNVFASALAAAFILLFALGAGAGTAQAAGGWNGFGDTTLPGASWRPYASTSPFNQSTSGYAVHPSSAAYVSKLISWGFPGNLLAGTAGQTNDWSHPDYYATSTDPVFTLHATKQVSAVEGMKIRIPDKAKPAGGADGHMAVVEPDGWEYDFWQVSSKPAGGGTLSFAMGGRTRIDGDGLRSAGTAANFGNLAGMIRGPELVAGHINHALFVVLKCTAKGTSFGYGTKAASQSWDGSYVYPATHPATACSTDSTDLLPAGARITLAMSDAQIAALPVPGWRKTILTALAHYGGYVGDTGGPGFGFMFESGSTYAALGLLDPLVTFAVQNGLPTYNGDYVYNVASGVDWARYLRVLVPPSPTPPATTTTGTGWNGLGGLTVPDASWRPYASTSPFNQSTSGETVHPDSANIVAQTLALGTIGNMLAGTSGQSNDWGHPTFYALSNDPVFTLHATGGSSPLEGMKIPIPDDARPSSSSDGHMSVVTPDGYEYDFFQVSSKPSGGGTLTFDSGGRTRIDGDGLGSGATAARFGSLAGMIRGPELAAGHIDHALYITVKCAAKSTRFGYGATATSESSYVYPAKGGGTPCATDDPDLPPVGTRFQLAMSDTQIAALAVPAWKKTILTALAHYGGYVGGTGGPGFALMFESGTTYTAIGLNDPLVTLAQSSGVPTWNGDYVFNLSDGVDWARYLRVLTPPSP